MELVLLDLQKKIQDLEFENENLKQFKDLYRQYREQYFELIKHSPAGLIELTFDGKVSLSNNAACRLLGFMNAEDILDVSLEDWIAGKDIKRMQDACSLIVKGKKASITIETIHARLIELHVISSAKEKPQPTSFMCFVFEVPRSKNGGGSDHSESNGSYKQQLYDLRSRNIKLIKSIRTQEIERKKLKETLHRKTIAFQELLDEIDLERKFVADTNGENRDSENTSSLGKSQFSGAQNGNFLPSFKHTLVRQDALNQKTFRKALQKLTPKEFEICCMIKQGLTVKEIAEASHTSPRTVETHRNNIRKKLSLANKKINLASYLRRF